MILVPDSWGSVQEANDCHDEKGQFCSRAGARPQRLHRARGMDAPPEVRREALRVARAKAEQLRTENPQHSWRLELRGTYADEIAKRTDRFRGRRREVLARYKRRAERELTPYQGLSKKAQTEKWLEAPKLPFGFNNAGYTTKPIEQKFAQQWTGKQLRRAKAVQYGPFRGVDDAPPAHARRDYEAAQAQARSSGRRNRRFMKGRPMGREL